MNISIRVITKLYLESILRMFFYWLVVYGVVLAGSSVLADSLIIDHRSLVISGLFLPFIFVYSMLFELADVRVFYKKYTGLEAFKKYALGSYLPIFGTGLVSFFLFLKCVIESIRGSYLPSEIYPVLLPLEFVAGCFLFVSRYHLLELERNSETAQSKSIVNLLSFNIIVLVYMAVAPITLFWNAENPKYSYAIGTTISFLIFIYTFFWMSFIKNRNKKKKVCDKFFFERPLVRESILNISICLVPFLVGLLSYLYVISPQKYLSLFFVVFSSSNVTPVLVLMFVFFVILENIRYMGRYDDSYLYRKIKCKNIDEDKKRELREGAFKKSHTNFLLLLFFLGSSIPVLLIYSDFIKEFIIATALYIGIGIIALTLILAPFNKMGIDDNVSNVKGEGAIKQSGTNDYVRINLITRSQMLILVRIIGAFVLILGIYSGYMYFQKSPVYFTKQGYYDKNKQEYHELGQEKDSFIYARYSPHINDKNKYLNDVRRDSFSPELLRFSIGNNYFKSDNVSEAKNESSLITIIAIFFGLMVWVLSNYKKNKRLKKGVVAWIVYVVIIVCTANYFNLVLNDYSRHIFDFNESLFNILAAFTDKGNYECMARYYLYLVILVSCAGFFQTKVHQKSPQNEHVKEKHA